MKPLAKRDRDWYNKCNKMRKEGYPYDKIPVYNRNNSDLYSGHAAVPAGDCPGGNRG